MALAAVVLLVATGVASAGTYDVAIRECAPDKPSPFVLSATRDMTAQTECGSGRIAVILRSAEGMTLPFEASANATLHAPEGTSFDSFEWVGEYSRPDCRWNARFLADGTTLDGAIASHFCDDLGRGVNVAVNLDRAKTISVNVECRDPAGCPVPAPEPNPWLRPAGGAAYLWESVVRVRDETPPSVKVLGLGDTGRRWVRGVQPLHYEANDSSGIQETSLIVAGGRERHVALCDFTRISPCPQGGGELSVDTTQLPDGIHPIAVQAVDVGSNASSDVVSAAVDNHAPAEVEAHVEGGSGWRRTNVFGVALGAPPEAHAPIVAAQYRLCRAGTADCVRYSRTRAYIDRLDLGVPGAGEWTMQVWREDEAGNVDERLASAPVVLRLDDVPPALAFEPHRMDDPRQVSAIATDRESGVTAGQIQLRPAHGRTWQSLPTRLDRGRLTAAIDDERLPDGTYELRAQARDQAGNEGTTNALTDGSTALLKLPLRAQARLTAGVVTKRAREKTRLISAVKARFGAALRLSGRLTNESGRPVRKARLHVYSRARGGRERPAGAVTTNSSGEFGYRLEARASGTMRIAYQGSRLLGPAQREVTLRVPAAAVLKVNRTRVLNGDDVVFTGRLRGRPFPRAGKIIQLQAYYPRTGWRNFATPLRADRAGRWRVPYRFVGTRGRVRYRFRVLVPREENYPFETGASNVIRVSVRGR